MIRIIGAGLAGTLAGALMPGAEIYEAEPSPQTLTRHRAVLRFRENRIAEAIGIPFTAVTVHKSIYDDGRHHNWATPRHINNYSRKVTGGAFLLRSIADLRTVTRYVAPPTLHQQLIELCGARIRWGERLRCINSRQIGFATTFSYRDADDTVISTMPLPAMLTLLPEIAPPLMAPAAPIHVLRYSVVGSSVHQTIYFPDPESPVYRATLTGEDLIIEAMSLDARLMPVVLEAFGMSFADIELVSSGSQRWGKIVELPAAVRKPLLYAITLQARVYSLGRFATYRNVLLDDVFHDLYRIRDMMRMSQYDLQKRAAL